MDVSRREVIGTGLAGSVLLPGGGKALAASAKDAPVTDLRVCGLEAPLVLDGRVPRLSWQLVGKGGEAGQSAYRVRVARSEADLAADRDLLWDSGKVASSAHFDIIYGGPALPPRARAVWQVDVWTEGSRKPLRSAPATWETGLGPTPQWQGEWLASETEVARRDRLAGLHWISTTATPKAGESRYFRTQWSSQGASSAELMLSAYEIVGVWLNGEPLAADQLWPATWTSMARYPLQLRDGVNVIAVEVRRVVSYGKAPPVLAAVIRHGPDLTERTTSATGWKASLVAPAGWIRPDFDASGWSDAVKASGSLPVGEPWPDYPANHLTRDFTVGKTIRSARLYASALGVYEAEINGRPVDTRKLAPEFTDPSKRVLYQGYDVTALLAKGANRLGFWVGNGWYGGKFSVSGRFSFGPAPCRMIAQLEIEYVDGSREVIATGQGWKITESAIRADSLYDGEIFDARLVRADWSRPGGGSRWREAEIVAAPKVPVEPQYCPPIRPHEALRPVAVTRLANGDRVFDFGQNFAGWPRLSVSAPAGTRIDMRFAEVLKPDGSVDQANLRTGQQHDIYFASGQGKERWEPRFTYHGFRYVQVSGLPEPAGNWSFEAVAGYQDLDLTGEFRTADQVIEKFWRNSVWSQKSNFWGLPTDCPQRDERLGWIGDAQVFWAAAAYNMDVTAFTQRVMDDMQAGQRSNGAFVDCIPPFVPNAPLSSPGWADGGVIMPHVAWQQSGDLGVVAANWESMERHLAWIQSNNPDFIWTKNRGADYGDWLAVDSSPNNPGLATTPKDLIGTAFWANNARLMAEMADALGKADAAARYRALFASIREAFNARFVQPSGVIGNESQTSYILPIRFGLLSDQARAEAGRRLVADIEKRGGHLSTGFLGTPYILDALADTGHADTAVSLLLQRSFPSWGYMVEKGATSMWERWDSDTAENGMNSLNHYAFGAITAFLFARIAGIAPAVPGFAKLRIAPIIDRRLGSAGATYRSASGTITTDWKVEGPRYRLDIALPPGTSAEVILPDGKRAQAGAGLHRYSGALV